MLFFFLHRYSISDLVNEKKYVVNVKITVCLEPSGPSTFTWDIFKDMYLPKLGCDWQIDFSGKYVYVTGKYISLVSMYM